MQIDVASYIGAVVREVQGRDYEGKPARVVVAGRSYDTDARRPLGRADQRRAHPALVPADQRRSEARRPLPARRQRRRDDHRLRTAAAAVGHLGVRRRDQLGERQPRGRRRRDPPGAGAHRPHPRPATTSGTSSARRGGRRLGPGPGGPWPAPGRRGAAVDHAEVAAWTASDEGKAFAAQSSDGWRRASIAFGTDEAAATAAAAETTKFYQGG